MQQFETDQEVIDRLNDVDEAMQRLRSVGEFTPAVVDELSREFLPVAIRKMVETELLVSRIEDTLAIESIRVNPRVTTSVLEGNALEDVDRYTQLAILNVNSANTFIENEAKMGSPLSLAIISETNRLIEQGGNESKKPGSFRDIPIQITGAIVQPPHWSEVRPLLENAIYDLETNSLHPIVAAAYMHWEVARIHPFENGNGRTARLTQDFVLIKAGLLPVGVPKSKREEYYHALEEADLGDGKALTLIVANSQISTLARAYEIASRPALREKKISQWIENLQIREKSTQTKKYEVWKAKTLLFQSEIKSILVDINSRQTQINFRVTEYTVPDQITWEKMLSAGGASKCFILRIEVSLAGKFAFKMLWFAKRHRLDWISSSNKHLKQEVGFFLDVRDDDSDQFETFQHLQNEQYFSIREVIPVSDGWIYTTDPRVTKEYELNNLNVEFSKPNWSLFTSGSLAEIVDIFIEDVMRKIGD